MPERQLLHLRGKSSRAVPGEVLLGPGISASARCPRFRVSGRSPEATW